MNELWSCLGCQHTVNLHAATSSFLLNLPCIHLRIMRPSLHTLFFQRGSTNRGTLQNHHEEARFTEDARQQQLPCYKILEHMYRQCKFREYTFIDNLCYLLYALKSIILIFVLVFVHQVKCFKARVKSLPTSASSQNL